MFINLSKKECTKLALMLALCSLLWGLAGTMLMLLMQVVAIQRFAVDSVNKHGVAEIQASRLGGAVVIFGCIAGMVVFTSAGHSNGIGEGLFGIDWYNWLAILGLTALGLVEDLSKEGLQPKTRLFAQFIIFISIFLLWPSLIPESLGFFPLDRILSSPTLGLLSITLFSIGFLNAVNISDGANGLVSSICVIFFTIIYIETGSLACLVMLYSSSVFLIFNVISGRLFLGDAGSYGIGTSLLIASLYYFGEEIVSLSFLAVIFFYPCVECLISILRRLAYQRPVMSPDNNHLHNKLHARYRAVFKSKNMANSLAGLTISGCTSGIAIVGYFIDPSSLTSNNWIWIFLFQCLVYGFTFLVSSGRPLRAQHILD